VEGEGRVVAKEPIPLQSYHIHPTSAEATGAVQQKAQSVTNDHLPLVWKEMQPNNNVVREYNQGKEYFGSVNGNGDHVPRRSHVLSFV
jgi:hypothetical protein